MDTVIVAVAQYLLFVLAAAVAVLVLVAPPRLRVTGVAAGLLGLALVGIGITVAAALHTDPRPFVVDPSLRPLFPHVADNGFPSDHSAAAALLAVVAWRMRRPAGIAAFVVAVLIGGSRVLSHVHHVQDIVAGLMIGLLSGAIALTVVQAAQARWAPDWAPALPRERSRSAQ